MEKETDLRLTWTGALICFLIYFYSTFPAFTSLSFFYYPDSLTNERVSIDIDLFVYDYLTGQIAHWLSIFFPEMPKARTINLGWEMATYAGSIVLSTLALVFAKILIGTRIPLGKFSIEALLWVISAILITHIFPALFILPPNLADTTWSYFLGPACAALSFRPDETTPTILLGYLFIGPVIIAPFTEEVTNRGLLGEIFRKSLGIWPAAFITSTLFGLAHLPSGIHMLTTFLMGLLFFAARMRFGGIFVPIVMHVTANASVTLPALYGC